MMAMLLMIGGCLMMLEPWVRARYPAPDVNLPITYVLGEAFSAEMHVPPEMRQLIARIH